MKLSIKLLLILLITLSLLLGSIYLAGQRMLLGGYEKIGMEQTTENVIRATQAIDQMVESLSHLLLTYAVWDDSYQFMVDKNKKYIDGNLVVSVLASSDLDMVLYFDVSGNPVFSIALNSDRTKEAPVPEEFSKAFQANGALRKLVQNPLESKNYQNSSGLFALSNGIVLLAAHPIVKSDGTGTPRGTVIMVRYLTTEKLQKIKDITGQDISVYPLQDINESPELLQVEKQLLVLNHPYINLVSDKIAYGYIFLRNVNNQPIAILKLIQPRTVYLIGKETMWYFYTDFILVCVGLIIILYYLIRILVIKRLEKINSMITLIGERKNFALRISEKGNDELQSFSTEMNKMFSVIETYDKEQQSLLNKFTYELDRVNSLSKKLQITEKLLTGIINFMPSILIIINSDMKIIRMNYFAEKESGLTIIEAQYKSLFDIFPFLEPYKNTFETTFERLAQNHIDKIISTNKMGSRYFNVMLYPLLYAHEQFLVVRIDDVTEKIKIEEKLMLTDRMASIGILTAGVAHEINNPINFVTASITPLRENILTLVNLLNMFIGIKSSTEFSEKELLIKQMKDSMNLNYVLKETVTLIDGIKDGAERTFLIVNSLKTFSRFDETAKKNTDINSGIDSTIKMLSHNLSDKVKITTEYGDIPKVACFPGKLNQVFMNIIANAIEAIPDAGEVIIKTESPDGKHIVVSIKDNGIGIPPENISKIFDPFFSTKEVGRGTGLGLSISAAIIRDHGGFIDVKSQVDKGTEFIITLPIE